MDRCLQCPNPAKFFCGSQLYCSKTCHEVSFEFQQHDCYQHCGVCATTLSTPQLACKSCQHPLCTDCTDLEGCYHCLNARRTPTVSPAKARKILHDKSVRGHKLTPAQRRMFGAWSKQK